MPSGSRSYLLCFVLFLLCLLASRNVSVAFKVGIPLNGQVCFHERLENGDSISLTYETSSGAHAAGIDFSITNPNGLEVVSTRDKEIGVHAVDANVAGTYLYCFSNERWKDVAKEVTFNLHVTRKADEPEALTDPLDKEIRRLSQEVWKISDEQEYIVIRERTHRDTAESTNSRVVWWSIFETVVLVSVCLWQVWYLRRFFEVKRVV